MPREISTRRFGMSAPRGRRRFLVAAVAAAGLLAPASALAANGSITGAVTENGTGNPVVGMKVAAHTTGGPAVKSTCSGGGGAYTIDDLVPGPYEVLFSVDTVACPGGPTDFAPRWYSTFGGSSLRQFADPVTVPDGGPVNASTAVRLGARIAGVVKEQATGTGVANVTVQLLNVGVPIATACTAVDGAYEFFPIGGGSFTVKFTADGSCGPTAGDFAVQWYDHSATEAGADPVNLNDGNQKLDVHADLLPSGSGGGGGADTTDPDTSITKKPKKKSTKKKVAVQFSASEGGSTFTCQVNKKAPVQCASGFKAKSKKGKNTLLVTAVDAAGNADDTPAVVKWRYAP
jgi:hypothetical protein